MSPLWTVSLQAFDGMEKQFTAASPPPTPWEKRLASETPAFPSEGFYLRLLSEVEAINIFQAFIH